MSGAPSSSRLPYDCQGALERSSIWTDFCFITTCVAAAAMTPTSSAQSDRTAMLYKVTWELCETASSARNFLPGESVRLLERRYFALEARARFHGAWCAREEGYSSGVDTLGITGLPNHSYS